MRRRLLIVAVTAAGLYVLLGVVLVIVLLGAPPLVIGEGRVTAVIGVVEQVDFRYWLLALVVLLWAPAIAAIAALTMVLKNGLLERRLTPLITEILEKRTLPITTLIDQRVPIVFDEPVEIPIDLATEISVSHDVDIEAELPVKSHLPVKTTVATRVLGIGNVDIPIEGDIPVNMVVPVKTTVRVVANNMKVRIQEVAKVQLPTIEAPIKVRMQPRVQLFGDLDPADAVNRRPTGGNT